MRQTVRITKTPDIQVPGVLFKVSAKDGLGKKPPSLANDAAYLRAVKSRANASQPSSFDYLWQALEQSSCHSNLKL